MVLAARMAIANPALAETREQPLPVVIAQAAIAPVTVLVTVLVVIAQAAIAPVTDQELGQAVIPVTNRLTSHLVRQVGSSIHTGIARLPIPVPRVSDETFHAGLRTPSSQLS